MRVISNRIKEKRKERKWTQQDLADKMGLSLDTIKSWESKSKDKTPRPENMKHLCRLLHTSEEYLLGGKDEVNEWLSKYDLDNHDKVSKLKQELGLLEYCDSIGCSTSELHEDSTKALITGVTNYIQHNYDDFLNERGLSKMTREDVKVIMNDAKNQVIDDFENGTLTVYATSEENLEQAFQNLVKRGMISE